MNREMLTAKHDLWDANIQNWEFYIRSYLGGNDYKNGYYLHRYILESPEEYDSRIRHTPLDNHCKNVVQIYKVTGSHEWFPLNDLAPRPKPSN